MLGVVSVVVALGGVAADQPGLGRVVGGINTVESEVAKCTELRPTVDPLELRLLIAAVMGLLVVETRPMPALRPGKGGRGAQVSGAQMK